ncbi:hypothetical protein Tco_0712122 [Tanacetum coccineum]
MKEEFPGWFVKQIRQRHVDNDPCVNESSELFALACRPSQTLILVNSCVVNGVRFVVHSRDERRITQNSGICLPGPDEEMYYGQLEQILEFSFLSFKTVLFRVKWFDTSNKGRIQNFVIRNNITQIKANGEAFKNDQYILKQKSYSTASSLNDYGQGTDTRLEGRRTYVDVPPDIIDVVDEDDDIIDEEDPIPHDLADSDDEDLANLDIDDGKGTQKPNLGGRRAGRLNTRQETWNLGLKAITDKNGPVPIRLEFGDRETLMPLGDHAAHWANYLGELVRELPLHYPSWRQIPSERKAKVVANIGMESSATREYPSLIHAFFLTHTVGGEVLYPEDKALYDEMLSLQGLGSNTSTGVPYTEDEIMAIIRGGNQRGHIPGVGWVLPGQGTVILPPPPCTHSSDVAKLKKSEKRLTKQVKMFMKLFRSNDKFSQMLTQLESQPEYGGGSGSGGCEDDEPGDDEDGDEDEEDG